uniref:ead/Ea22-like family protein n=1 Tax=Klebsiella michiganensis TaxID=1134687 RepID=UPI002115629B
MTTDITELAQSLKAAAFNVKETAHIARYVKSTIARQTFKELMTPDNILALVEALEKAQQHIARQEQILLNQDESLYIRRGELEKAQQRIVELDRKNCELDSLTQRWAVERAENADRIAELESSTVKLPDDAEHDIMAPVAAYLSEKFKWDGRAVRWDGRNEYDALADRVKYALRMVIRR